MATTAMLLNPTEQECIRAMTEEFRRRHIPETDAAREGTKFWAHYEMVGWKVGKAKTKMVSMAGAITGWALRYQERQEGQASRRGQPSPSVQMMVLHDEYKRVLHRISVIEQTYQHQKWDPVDKGEHAKLVVRRDTLRKQLGIQL